MAGWDSPSCRSYCADDVVVCYLPVLANGSGDRAAWAEYRRPFTRSSHLSSAARPFAILNARKAVRDLVPQTPSAGPSRNPSSISRLCAALISLGGGFNLASCIGATTALRSAWADESATACFAASVLSRWKKIGSITIDKRAAPPMKTAIIPIPVCRPSLCRAAVPISRLQGSQILNLAWYCWCWCWCWSNPPTSRAS
jgi:hypothetical protein